MDDGEKELVRMGQSMKLIVENIRCFAGRHEIPIKPLTILVGENSSGKTTILAALASAFNADFPNRPAFNYPPYDLGSFESIATATPGRSRRVRSFSLGYEGSPWTGHGFVKALATYKSISGDTRLLEFHLTRPNAEAHIKRNEGNTYHADLKMLHNGKTERTQRLLPARYVDHPYSRMYSNLLQIIGQTPELDLWERYTEAFSVLLSPGTLSIAPIRMKPRRSYARLDPEGDHVPAALAGIFEGKRVPGGRRQVIGALRRFGKESGLFNDIRVKRLGRQPGDPFQVLVDVGDGRWSNLMDVGYGVSQSLPVIVEIVLNRQFLTLLQQPEAQLHPQAQAALGSFFADIVAKTKKWLVVETHSDYIVDRIRQEVASGALAPDDVVILYLERKRVGTKVFPLTLDKLGNIEGAPRTYRDFFLRETMNLLSRGN